MRWAHEIHPEPRAPCTQKPRRSSSRKAVWNVGICRYAAWNTQGKLQIKPFRKLIGQIRSHCVLQTVTTDISEALSQQIVNRPIEPSKLHFQLSTHPLRVTRRALFKKVDIVRRRPGLN